tara:strand:+ start:12026 stop:12586 length:561 start_codon:yes stop_codon:yes gene_type:complete
MFLYPICLIGLLLLSCIVQQFIPAVSAWYDARILILPLVVLCGSATVSTAGMLTLAFLGGFLWDAQQVLIIEQGDHIVYQSNPDALKFGYSIVLYTLMGFLMQGIRPLFQEGKWYLSAALTGVAIFLYLFVEYLLRGFIIGGFSLDNGMIEQIGATSVLTMLFSPIIFWGLFRIAELCGHTISYRH